MTYRADYIARINRVIDHVDAHLASPLDLQALATVANFSPFHFHRLFHALTGETLADHVRRRRLEKAARLLVMSPPRPVSLVAHDVGFSSTAVFTRTFRSHFGATPTAWRRGAFREWAGRRQQELSKIHQSNSKEHQQEPDGLLYDVGAWQRSHASPSTGGTMQVQLKTLPAARLAYMRNVGPYGDPGINRMWQRFMAWVTQHDLAAQGRTMYGVSQDSPDVTASGKLRYDAAIEIPDAFEPDGDVGIETIPGGRYACTQFTGTPDRIYAAWMEFFANWLPDSGYQYDSRPALERMPANFANDPNTGAFTCELCIPVKPL